MFDSLKNRLKVVSDKLGISIQEKADVPEGEKAPSPPLPKPPKQVNQGGKSPKITDKVKTLVSDRELLVTGRDVAEPLAELEMALLESDVALPVVDEIVDRMRSELIGKHRRIGVSVDSIVHDSLRSALLSVLGDGLDLGAYIDEHEHPVRILFTGVNGTGKTTTIAKIAHWLKENGYSVVIGSGDTFRAGAGEQMQTHADRVGVRVIRHQAGADPSAVLFDAVQYARAHEIDVVLADTAGRFHNRANLMNQLGKIKRVMKPDLVVYVDEAVAGNDAVVRAEEFNNTVGTDAVVLTKADMDSRGGAAISIAHTVGRPIIFLGVGQGYDDVVPFSPRALVDELLGGDDNA
jgi:fused signal recognition particle receptor